MFRYRFWLVVVGLATVLSPAAHAQETWRSLGPEGGSVDGLAVDPRDGRVLLAATAAGLFRSTNSGHSWQAFGTGLNGAPSDLARDPLNPRVLLAATDHGIFRSADSGLTWVASSSGLPPGSSVVAVRMLPFRRGVALALSRPRCGFPSVVRSTDGGTTWSVVTRGLPEGVYWADLRPDPFMAGVTYLASDTGVYRSRDAGRSWRLLSLSDRSVAGIEPDPFHPGRLWAIAQDPTTASPQVLLSADGGLHWQLRDGGQGLVAEFLAADPARRDHLYVGTADGLFLTADAGRSWRKVFDGSVSILIGDRRTGTLTAGSRSADYGVARSQNGTSWVTFQSGLRATRVAVSVGGGSVLWASGASHPWRSDDDGNTWATVQGVPGTSFMAADPTSPTTAYSATFEHGLYRTSDSGASWQFAGPQAAPAVAGVLLGFLLDPLQASRLYLFDTTGLYGSVDGADSWQLLWTPPQQGLPRLVAVGAGSPPALVLAYVQEVRYYQQTDISRSIDNGATWSHVATFPPPDNASTIVPDPSDGQRLWAVLPGYQCSFSGQIDGGVSRSFDGGATWQESEVDSSGSFVSSLLLDPSDPDVLFAGTSAGVYVSRDAGASWQALAGGLPPGGVTGLALRPGTPNTLYAATAGGAYALTLP